MNIQQNKFPCREPSDFRFYRVPKALMDSGLSLDAAVLYSLLLDRLKLSVRNRWADQQGRVYVYFTLDEVRERIRCGHNKATALMRELERAGLIERVRQGLGKPARIYVERFREQACAEDGQAETRILEAVFEGPAAGCQMKAAKTRTGTTFMEPAADGQKNLTVTAKTGTSSAFREPAANGRKSAGKTAKNHTGSEFGKTARGDRTAERLFFSAQAQAVQSERQGDSRLPETVAPECREQAAIKTEKNQTEFIKINPSIPITPSTAEKPARQRRNQMDEMGWIQKEIRYHIDYDGLLRDHPQDAALFDGYVSLMAEACCTNRECLRVCGEEVPAVLVRKRLLSLEREHILYVRDCLAAVTARIANIKAYTLAALYNAPVTIEQYYDAMVSRDFAQEK